MDGKPKPPCGCCDQTNETPSQRKRRKQLFAQIREQMLFYFSDANLSKDRFLKKAIDESEDGFVDLAMFINFNKIRSLTTCASMVRRAVASVDFFQLSDDGKRIKRATEFVNREDENERTVYVESLPKTVSHDWLKKTFSVYGKVVYVSIPRYHSTGVFKGFAFIEFENKEDVQKACKALNQPTDGGLEKVGQFPKSNKQLRQLQKNLDKQELEKLDTMEKVDEEMKGGDASGGVRAVTAAELTDDAVTSTEQKEITDDTVTSTEHKQQTSEFPLTSEHKEQTDESVTSTEQSQVSVTQISTEMEDTSKEGESSNRKRQHPDDSGELEYENQSKKAKPEDSHDAEEGATATGTEKTSQEAAVPVEVEENTRVESEDAGIVEAKQSSCTDNENVDATEEKDESDEESESEDEPGDGDGGGGSDAEAEPKRVRISDKVEVQNVTEGKKKRKQKKKKEKVKEEIPALKVIPKIEWIKLKREYILLQRQNMKLMKRLLREHKEGQDAHKQQEKTGAHVAGSSSSSNPQPQASTEASSSTDVAASENTSSMDTEAAESTQRGRKLVYTPGVIVKFQSDHAIDRHELKDSLPDRWIVAYIEIDETSGRHGYVRCKSADGAKQLLETELPGITFSMAEGEEESSYWEKIKEAQKHALDKKAAIQKKRMEKKKRFEKRMRRGQQKIIAKGERLAANLSRRQHIVFDDW